MPVFSYLAMPNHRGKTDLCEELSSLEFCQVIPSDNQDVVVLLTDTPNEEEEKRLQEKLKTVKALQSLSLTFGHSDND